MSEEIVLGKIDYVAFGLGGYQDVQLGLTIGLSGQGSGCTDFIGWWDYAWSTPDEQTKWTEADRSEIMVKLMRKISELLEQAKVRDVYKLKGTPVEITYENRTLKSWRILEEVL